MLSTSQVLVERRITDLINSVTQEITACVMEVQGVVVGLVVVIVTMIMTVKMIFCVGKIIAGICIRIIREVRKCNNSSYSMY